MTILTKMIQSVIKCDKTDQLTEINYWRQLIFTGAFLFGLISVFPAYISGQFLAIESGRWEVFIINTILYLLGLALALTKEIECTIRSAIGVHIPFVLGAVLCFVRGPLSAGPIWLFAFPVMSGVLLGKRFALYALSLNGLVFLCLSLFILSGSVDSWVSVNLSMGLWITYSLNHLSISVIVTLSLVILMSGLEGNIERVRQMARSLEGSNQDLKEQIDACLQANREREEAERQLRYMAYHDYLTGLPNRASYIRRLQAALHLARWDPSFRFALLFLDLDQFKTVNDSLGHLVGDQLLKQVGEKLAEILNHQGGVCRLGGDEFAFLIEGDEQVERLQDLIDQIFAALREPILCAGHQISFTASIGIVLDADPQTTPEFLLRDADIAMYRAKASGRAQAIVLDEAMRKQFTQRFEWETDLGRAIENQEFILHYQPIVCLSTGRLLGFEAVVRWRHPSKGLIYPNDFIPLAEETGFIITLGSQVLDQACAQLRAWRDQMLPCQDLKLNINLSAKQFDLPDLSTEIGSILDHYGLSPEMLTLELTESTIMGHAETATDSLRRLKAQGFKIALDDFGTGYSSLAYLQKFPIDTIKIDKSFILPLLEDLQNLAVVEGILFLAQSLSCDAVAEGVETQIHADLLKQIGCPMAQGWFYGKPISAEAVNQALFGEGRSDQTGSRWSMTCDGLVFDPVESFVEIAPADPRVLEG